jgi:hypothetical protein
MGLINAGRSIRIEVPYFLQGASTLMKYTAGVLLSAFFLLSCGMNASATDAKNGYLILGPGAYSCRQIISDLARDAKNNNPASVIVYSTWLAGNLTAYNREVKGTYSILGGTPFTESFAWAVQYCHDHPDRIYAAAADELVARLKPHRYAAMPRKEEQDSGDKEDDDDESDRDDAKLGVMQSK